MEGTKPGQGNPNPKDSNKFREDMKAAEIAARDLAKDMGYVLENLKESGAALNKAAKTFGDMAGASKKLNALAKDNVQIAKDLGALYDEELQNRQTLLLKQNMIGTGLKGQYAQTLTTYMLENNIKDLNDKKLDALKKELQGRQHINEKIVKQTELEEAKAAWMEEMHEELEGYTMGWEKLKSKIKAVATDPKVAKAFFAAEGLKAAKEGLEGMEKRFDALKQSGLSAGQAAQGMVKSTSAMSILGLSDTQGVMQGMVEQYGNVNALSGDMVDDLGQMAVHMGITGQEAMKLNASLSQMPGETAESAKNAMEHVGHMAEMEGIAPGKIMKDMAGNTAEMARAGGKGAEAFGKSVIALHKMGVEMTTASKMADSLLDFESSINNQMEASMLLGKDINLDKARELALNNDLEGATAEVLKNVGGSAEFNKLNRLQQDALAKSLGLSVEEMGKYIDAQEEQEKYHGKAAGFWMNVTGYAMEFGSKVGGFLKEHGMLMISALNLLQNTNLTKTKGRIADAAHWVKEKAHILWLKANAVFGGEKASTAAKDKLAEMGKDKAKDLSSKLKKDGTLDMRFKENKIPKDKIPKDLGATNKALDAAGSTSDKAKDLSEKSSKVNPAAGGGIKAFLKQLAAGLKSFGKGAGDILKGAATLAAAGVLLGLGLAAIGAAVKAMGGSPTEMIMIGAALVLFAGSFWIMSKALGKMSISDVMKGSLAMVILGAALIPAAYAFSLIANVPIANMIAFAAMLPLLAIGVMALGMALAGPQAAIFMLGIAALAMLGGVLIVLGAGLLIAGIGMEKFAKSAIVVVENLQPIAESIMGLGAMVGPLIGVAAALMGVGAGLAFMSIAGLGAIPIIGALMGLAALAPNLISLGEMFGMGGKKEEEKPAEEENGQMKKLIEEIQGLRTDLSTVGVINMDGKKVGEVIRLAMNTSGVS